MRIRTAVVVAAVAVATGACTTARSTPATAPSTSAPPTNATTIDATTTTTSATTTTVDRVAEVTAIFEDLERRRLAAIAAGDEAAFSDLFADTPYLDRSLAVFDFADPGPPPTVTIQELTMFKDTPDCLVFLVRGSVDGEKFVPSEVTLTPAGGSWVYAYVAEEGGAWLCGGEHPLAP